VKSYRMLTNPRLT